LANPPPTPAYCAAPHRTHHPLERPAPGSHWQLDFKDASTVPPDPDGKQQHVVEVLNTVDASTSSLLNAQARSDFTMSTALEAVARTVQDQDLPQAITIDRDTRFVGAPTQRVCPVLFLRFSSEVLTAIFAEHHPAQLPDWCSVVSIKDYQGRKYEKIQAELLKEGSKAGNIVLDRTSLEGFLGISFRPGWLNWLRR
jgi:hypothetical protein